MSKKISIRAEQDGDFKSVYNLVKDAFGSNKQADLVSRLREESFPKLSLVAIQENEILGHIFYSPIEIENNSKKLIVAQLSPISILPEYQKKGIGSNLITSSLKQCLEIGWSAIFLVGSPLYYRRFGFEMADTNKFNHQGPYADYLQCKELQPSAFDFLSGNVKFHPAFNDITS